MNNKIPIPPIPPKTNLYKSINFWADIMLKLDKKVQNMEENMGFGEVGITIIFHRGKIHRIVWEDNVSDISLVEKSGGTSNELEEEKKPIR